MTEQTYDDIAKTSPTSSPSSKKKVGQKISKKERSGSTFEAKSKVNGGHLVVVVRMRSVYIFGSVGAILPSSPLLQYSFAAPTFC